MGGKMSDFYRPGDPKNMPLRPLDGGMVLNRPSQTLSGRQCVDAKNYIISEERPKRRPEYEPYGSYETGYETFLYTEYRHIDLFTFWTSNTEAEEQELLLITAGPLFRVGLGGMIEIPWTYETGTIDVSGTTVTGNGTDFTGEDVYPGDLVRCGGAEARIHEIFSATELSLEEATLSDGSSLNYSIQRSFNSDSAYLADWQVHDNEVIFTDYNAPLCVYDHSAASGSQLSMFIDNDAYRIDSGSGPEDFIARSLTVFNDRLFVGNLIEATDGARRQRIRWSSATNIRDFSESTAYIDLPYTQGSIVRLIPLENMLVVYMTDAIYVGTPANNPYLPVVFQRVETGNIGLVGMKAITRFLNGHFFVGQDDIYIMTSRGPERIGAPIIGRTIKESGFRERLYVAPDVENDRVVFGFNKGHELMTELWAFNYKTQAWSYDIFDTYMISNPLLSFTLTWNALAGFTWSETNSIGEAFPTWDAMGAKETYMKLFVESGGAVRQLSDNSEYDRAIVAGAAESQPIEAVYETGDFDFEEPDQIKTFLRLGMKVDFSAAPSDNVVFVVQGSHNRGRSWKSLGSLIIRTNYDEGYVNFLISSSHVRFRITTTAQTAPFVISEIVLKARRRGSENTPAVQLA
jgi:hypothetical protein